MIAGPSQPSKIGVHWGTVRHFRGKERLVNNFRHCPATSKVACLPAMFLYYNTVKIQAEALETHYWELIPRTAIEACRKLPVFRGGLIGQTDYSLLEEGLCRTMRTWPRKVSSPTIRL
jgi:hypothetical protein